MSKVEPNRPKRQKTGGRVKGTPNKITGAAKDAIALVFDQLGGTDALKTWVEASDDNRKVFYSTIYPKLIPVQLSGDADNPLAHSLTVRFV